MDAVAAVVAETGLRAHLGEAYFSSQGPQGRERSLEFGLRHRDGADGRITTALSPHAPCTVDDADLAATAELAHAHGLPVHIHASENREQTDTSLARHGITPIEVLKRTGILDTDVLLFAWPTTTPVRALHDIGVPVGLATDGAARRPLRRRPYDDRRREDPDARP
ncbi:Amidohydrolase OS=Streptomyces alboniger OX=132473 GN=CP975_08480 PE=4 SV=1 [Streptomyces alboniger]